MLFFVEEIKEMGVNRRAHSTIRFLLRVRSIKMVYNKTVNVIERCKLAAR